MPKRPAKNPDAVWNSNHRRRLRGGRYESVSRATVYERDHGRCHICGQLVDPANWHADHIVPISHGGDHVQGNLAVAHPSCNHRRGDGWDPGLRVPPPNDPSVITIELDDEERRAIAHFQRHLGVNATAVLRMALRQLELRGLLIPVPTFPETPHAADE